jgi:hypothetical protein
MSSSTEVNINYWDCKYCDYDIFYDEETYEEDHYYGCKHEDNSFCDKDNKWNGEEDLCEFAKLND